MAVGRENLCLSDDLCGNIQKRYINPAVPSTRYLPSFIGLFFTVEGSASASTLVNALNFGVKLYCVSKPI